MAGSSEVRTLSPVLLYRTCQIRVNPVFHKVGGGSYGKTTDLHNAFLKVHIKVYILC